jgi:hypothetical protein
MDELTKYAVSWFLPEWLGGLGIPIDHPSELSIDDRKAATVIKMMMNTDKRYRPVKPKDMAMWKMHQLVDKDLGEFKYMGTPCYREAIRHDGSIINFEENWSKLYKLSVINLLEKETLKTLYDEVKEDNSVRASMYHNVRVLQYAKYKIGTMNPEPMCDSDLLPENKELVLPCFVGKFGNFAGLRDDIDESL